MASRLPAEQREALSIIRSTQASYIPCWRRRRHRFPLEEEQVYDFFNGYRLNGRVQGRATHYTIVLECETCGTLLRYVRVKSTGESVTTPYYIHPDGYSRAGTGVDWLRMPSSVFYVDLYKRLTERGEGGTGTVEQSADIADIGARRKKKAAG